MDRLPLIMHLNCLQRIARQEEEEGYLLLLQCSLKVFLAFSCFVFLIDLTLLKIFRLQKMQV